VIDRNFFNVLWGADMSEKLKMQLDNYTEIISSLDWVLQIYLFGSHAYGTPDDNSDIDLMVVIDDELDVFKTAYKIQRGLANRVVPLDVLVNNESAFYEAADSITLQAHIVKEGTLLYESQ
jgi:predicted nucleotidyltransferase